MENLSVATFSLTLFLKFHLLLRESGSLSSTSWKMLVPQRSCGIDWNRCLNHQHPSNSTKNGVVQLALRILSSLALLPETKDSSNNYIKKFFYCFILEIRRLSTIPLDVATVKLQEELLGAKAECEEERRTVDALESQARPGRRPREVLLQKHVCAPGAQLWVCLQVLLKCCKVLWGGSPDPWGVQNGVASPLTEAPGQTLALWPAHSWSKLPVSSIANCPSSWLCFSTARQHFGAKTVILLGKEQNQSK